MFADDLLLLAVLTGVVEGDEWHVIKDNYE
jgi:hypothetical protein